ncbi:hypothetical protein MKW94_018646 [Papaver nudicaule]|uniref:SHSP domain-containing protein n=1 Tax=Papaver nudicaule TaxID=74823 RepID=A0AA41UWZ6_PAPNU|nr:hypothetical protein [Papaver nudicaule]
MELEIGLKITKTRDDGNLTTSNLRITKDGNGPVFVSSETESMFVLTAHLKGYRRERIMIDINEDGSLISISGEKTIQEMVMVRWTMYKKEAEITRFKKIFRIPNGVKLNRIKARFNEEETVLSIFMPKSKKGIQGVSIEEVIEVAEEQQQEEEKVVEEADVVQENESEKPEVMLIKNKDLESLDVPEVETREISTAIEEIPEMVTEEEDEETEMIEPGLEETPYEEAPGEVVQEPTENMRTPELETVTLKEEEVEECIEEVDKQEDPVEDTSFTSVEPVEEPLKHEDEQEPIEETIEQELEQEEMKNDDKEESPIEDPARSPTNGTSPWLQYPFGTPGFLLGSTLFGIIIALVVHFLNENKKLKKYGTS